MKVEIELFREAAEVDREGTIRKWAPLERHPHGIGWTVLLGDDRSTANRIDHVGDQREMKHFFHRHATDEIGSFPVLRTFDAQERDEIRRQRGPFQFQRELQAL